MPGNGSAAKSQIEIERERYVRNTTPTCARLEIEALADFYARHGENAPP